MDEQNKVVNLVPGVGGVQTYNCSQGDIGRTLEFTIINGSSVYSIPSDATVTVAGTKPSGMGFSEVCTITADGTAKVDTTEAMTQEPGRIWSELRIVDADGANIGTANFVLAVEKSPHDASVTDGTIAEAKTIFERADEAIAKAEQMIEEVEVYNSIVEEVEDIRIGADSTVYDSAGDAVRGQISELKKDLNELVDEYSEYGELTPDSTVTDYLFNWTNKTDLASTGMLYKVYTVPPTVKLLKITGRNFDATYYALYAFENARGEIIAHYDGTNYKNLTDLEVEVPAGAVKVYVNGQDNSAIQIPPSVKADALIDVVGKVETLETEVENLKNENIITISCFGDSTTDGAFVSGEHGAEYGKAPYPARLKTILTDNGYDINVINSGEAGERTPDTTIRVGGFPCVLTEAVTIPADNTPQPLGTNLSSSRGRVFGTTLQIPLTGRDGTDFCVYFTASSVSKSPNVYMDGIELVVTRGTSSPYPNYIAKKNADGEAVTIPAGTFLFTEDDRNDDINIVMTGINDQYALRMNDWLAMMQKCLAASKRCLIVSSWVPLFNAWYDITGSTTAEKYTEFKNAVNPLLGIYHVDMYDLWYRHALDYAQASGYLTDLTTEQEATIRTNLANHVIPAEFTYNNTEGENHLNEAGYQVVAMIIFDRLKRVSFI